MPASPFTLPTVTPGLPSYDKIMQILQTPTPNESDFLPEIQKILGGSSEFLKPAIYELQTNIGSGLADLEGDYARKGLTGSSIESQGLATARGRGYQAMAGLVGDFAKTGANTFAQLLARARAGDVEATRQLRLMLAQATGQELTAGRDIEMFNQQLSFNAAAADQARKSGIFGAKMDLIGSIIGAGAQAYSGRKGTNA